MSDTIKRARDEKLVLCLESTEGFPATDLACKKLGKENIRFMPAEMLGNALIEGDMVLAFRAGGLVAKAATKALGIRVPKLPPSGYKIECVKHDTGKMLVVVGGDLFGMLAGLSDALLNGEMAKRGFIYRGGARTEKPAFALRYYWTWDHSTNWVLDDPGNQRHGASMQYLKKPETFVEDYRRLVDHCIDMRFNGIVIFGFLRDIHGGQQHAYQVAKYAADRGVAIMPGGGSTGFGGIYFDGRHPCNLETHLAGNPRLGNMHKDGSFSKHELSPYYPENREWIRRSLEWLYRSFPIGGVNLENSDLMVDYSPVAKRERKKIKSNEADYFKDQYFAYKTALEIAHSLAPNAWNTYATYSGFGFGTNLNNADADMRTAPYYSKRMPESAIAQWTLTGMLSKMPVPLRDWMGSSRPKSVYGNPRWPKGLIPPTPRSCGFIHQASQWNYMRRNCLAMSTFAEACLRSYEAGLEGISIHGEVTSRSVLWLLNYLAMRHWTYHPVSTLEEFALAELAPRVGGRKEALEFVRVLCDLDERKYKQGASDLTKDSFPWWENPAWEPMNRYNPLYSNPNANYSACRLWEALWEWAMTPFQPGAPSGFTDLI